VTGQRRGLARPPKRPDVGSGLDSELVPTNPGIDGGRLIDWGRTSADYSVHRPGPPPSFYEKLRVFDVGVAGQRMLDLGTGTGALAREFARAGARVSGIDVSQRQIAEATRLAAAEGLEIDFRVGPAEELPFGAQAFDVATANQCLLYFHLARVIPELRRVLTPEGLFMVSHFSFLPRLDPIARASEALVLEHNPDWSAAGWDGRIPAWPGWSREHFDLRAMFYYDERIPFTRQSWRGRMRALRGIGASLPPEGVEAFDRDLERLLDEIAPERFEVLHRIDVHLFQFRRDEAPA
jgi:SAM-dependent methyltransferase